jgi:hypothetical protein
MATRSWQRPLPPRVGFLDFKHVTYPGSCQVARTWTTTSSNSSSSSSSSSSGILHVARRLPELSDMWLLLLFMQARSPTRPLLTSSRPSPRWVGLPPLWHVNPPVRQPLPEAQQQGHNHHRHQPAHSIAISSSTTSRLPAQATAAPTAEKLRQQQRGSIICSQQYACRSMLAAVCLLPWAVVPYVHGPAPEPNHLPFLQEAEGSGGCLGWAARDKSAVLAPLRFTRRELQPNDIHIQITHAGGGWGGHATLLCMALKALLHPLVVCSACWCVSAWEW